MNQVVLIKGDRITEAGPVEKIKIPAGAEIVDLSRTAVLPGLIDCYTHVFGNGPDFETQIRRDSDQYRTLVALANAQKDLMVGFTPLGDLKALGALCSDNAINRGIVQGLRTQVATRGIQATGGFIQRGLITICRCRRALEVVDSPRGGTAGSPRLGGARSRSDQGVCCLRLSFRVGRQNGDPADLNGRGSERNRG